MFEGGAVSWSSSFGPIQPAQNGRTPVSEALRRVGVELGDALDEFEVLGLGRHRHTGDWA